MDTPHTQDRTAARLLARAAAAELLAARLGGRPDDIALISVTGQPLRVAGIDQEIGLSLNHEAGLSLVAVHFGGRVGIDLLRISTTPDWLADVPCLAQDYLGPDVAHELEIKPSSERARRFAERWTRLEAGLKCLEIGLSEWTPALQLKLERLEYLRLELPSGYIGTVAVPAGS